MTGTSAYCRCCRPTSRLRKFQRKTSRCPQIRLLAVIVIVVALLRLSNAFLILPPHLASTSRLPGGFASLVVKTPASTIHRFSRCRSAGGALPTLLSRSVASPSALSSSLSSSSSHEGNNNSQEQATYSVTAKEDSPPTSVAVPSLATLLRFTIPTLGIWLAGPIMSLVDTSVVGLSSSVELAAMGPATNLCDSFLYVFTFLAVATTNLLAAALADNDKEKSQTVVSHALAISLAAGMIVTLVIEIFGTQMLKWTVGADGNLLIPLSLKYTSIRALGAPAVLVSMVAQAALLGARDSVTPLVVTIAAGFINLILDIVLVPIFKLGISGAAVATVIAEVVGTWVLLIALKKSQGPKRKYPFIWISDLKDLTKFFSFAGPVFFALFGKTVCYTSLGIAAQMLGTIPLAAHQVMLRCFFFFTTFGDSLSTTAQAFLPGFLVNNNTLAIGKVMRRLIILGVGVGGANALLAGLIPSLFPGLFTTSAGIIQEMKNLAPWLSGSLLAHACTMALEGILLANRELTYLASSYAINTVLMLGGLLGLRRVGLGIQGVWGCLLFFQVSRLAFFAWRLLVMKGGKWEKGVKRVVGRFLGRRREGGEEAVVI